jgi:hypothetical protein
MGVSINCVSAQDKAKPVEKVGPQRPVKDRAAIPLVRVQPRPIAGDFPGFPERRSPLRTITAPSALSSSQRESLLRESGFDLRPVSAPAEFRLSPRQPYVSSSAYLFFSGNTEFNAAADSLLLHIETRLPSPAPRIPGFGPIGGWDSASPVADPPTIVGVLVRVDPRSRYVADFSVSSDAANTYRLTATGAGGSGNFPKEAGGQHVIVVLDSSEGGYVVLNFWAERSFTFHNVLVTKFD